MKTFTGAKILLPNCDMTKWATIACDQHTSEKKYWDDVAAIVGDAPSTFRITLPEIYLSDEPEKRIKKINATMREYYDGGLFTEYNDSMIYIERRLANGRVRRGIVGAIRLDDYDYTAGAKTPVRATEKTVPDRLPPRVAIRSGALLEAPHVMLLIDDPKDTVIGSLSSRRNTLEKAYGFDLMLGSGHIDGYFVDDGGRKSIDSALDSLCTGENPLLFAVGDGNHSLAAAKECRRLDPEGTSEYALVEVVNIHDEALDFHPIYRVLFNVSPSAVLDDMSAYFGGFSSSHGQRLECISSEGTKIVYLPERSKLTVSTLQAFIDDYLAKNPEASIDYIHGERETRELASRENAVGFIFDGMKKSELFPAVSADGSLVRKTFSMGEACDKRYYVETAKIR